jgi:anti-sigma-K factor RskA
MSGSDGHEDPDIAAAEYVVGTLDAGEREAFIERLNSDEAARTAVARWQRRFAGLALLVDPVTPPSTVWTRIEQSLGLTGQAHPFRVISGGQTAKGNAMKRSRDRWRIAAVATGMVAAALLFLLVQRTTWSPEEGAEYIAAVNRGGVKPALIVRVDMKTGRVFIRPIFAETPEGHSLELWYIGSDKTPRSMGVLSPGPAQATLPAGDKTSAATFAVSVEPVGGSKSGGPTGPVIYTGQLVRE